LWWLKREKTVVHACIPIIHVLKVYTNIHRSIATNGGKGCARRGLVKWQHSVVYTSKDQPKLLPGERPAQGELGMMPAIRVKPLHRAQKMDPASRINLAKIYTVEHNVKVYDFGSVESGYISKLLTSWNYVLSSDLYGNPEEADGDQEETLNAIEDGRDGEEAGFTTENKSKPFMARGQKRSELNKDNSPATKDDATSRDQTGKQSRQEGPGNTFLRYKSLIRLL
jgi:hypothetical protein